MASGNVKKRVSVALVGHKGSGKSTLLGQMLWLMGDVDPAQMKKIEAVAARKEKRASRFAMVQLSSSLLIHMSCLLGICTCRCAHLVMSIELTLAQTVSPGLNFWAVVISVARQVVDISGRCLLVAVGTEDGCRRCAQLPYRQGSSSCLRQGLHPIHGIQ